MKILIFSNSFWNIYNFRLPIINKLKINNKITIVAKKDNYYNKFLNINNVRLKKLNFSSKSTSIFSNISIFFKFFFILKKEKPDLLITFTIKPNIFGSIASRILNIKTINNITGLGTVFLKKNYLLLLIKFLFKFSFKKTKIVFFHNSFEKFFFISSAIIKKKQARIINGSGINPKNYRKKIFSRNRITNKFVFSGRMISDKGIYELIEAIKIVKKKYKYADFSIFGLLHPDNVGAIPQKTIQFWIDRGFINFYPNVKKINNHLSNFDCFIMPSYSEGMSRSLLEAASSGLPILCSNIPGCREIVKSNFNGFLFKPKNIRSLSNSIIKFIHLPTQKRILFGNKSRYIIQNNFTEEKITKDYLTHINEIFKKNK
jgi:glycosyltransferase involved in cell wall biosynthesis